jgi:hypothetical protein
MVFWLALAAATAWLLWYMVRVPGVSYPGEPQPPTPAERSVADTLRRHVTAIASREHNLGQRPALDEAAQYIERALAGYGYTVARQPIETEFGAVHNIEAEVQGDSRGGEIVLVGAHYDSVAGAPGANDNGSGVAAMLELARVLRRAKPQCTLRFVAFVNEEPPYFTSEQMGSRHYARRSRERGENIIAMFSLETIGYYSIRPGSQRYPFPLGFFYPSTGDFVAFVSNLRSHALLHRVIASFRRHALFPSEAVAAPAFVPGVDWSDHRSFWQEGYPALMVTDTALFRYPYYHTSQDTPDKVDYGSLARVVAGLRAMLAELAGTDSDQRAEDPIS